MNGNTGGKVALDVNQVCQLVMTELIHISLLELCWPLDSYHY